MKKKTIWILVGVAGAAALAWGFVKWNGKLFGHSLFDYGARQSDTAIQKYGG